MTTQTTANKSIVNLISKKAQATSPTLVDANNVTFEYAFKGEFEANIYGVQAVPASYEGRLYGNASYLKVSYTIQDKTFVLAPRYNPKLAATEALKDIENDIENVLYNSTTLKGRPKARIDLIPGAQIKENYPVIFINDSVSTLKNGASVNAGEVSSIDITIKVSSVTTYFNGYAVTNADPAKFKDGQRSAPFTLLQEMPTLEFLANWQKTIAAVKKAAFAYGKAIC
jgi:hypothetical protein